MCITSHSAPANSLILPAPPAQLVDDSVGANCQLATTTDTPWRPAAASPKHRFQEGSVDEVRLQHSTAVPQCWLPCCCADCCAAHMLLRCQPAWQRQDTPRQLLQHDSLHDALLSRSSMQHSTSSHQASTTLPVQVSFLAPDLGPLAALMVAPESGCWALDEVHVSSSRTNHMDRWEAGAGHVCGLRCVSRDGGVSATSTRILHSSAPTSLAPIHPHHPQLSRATPSPPAPPRFVCRRKIGVKAEMAAYLSPIPAGAVVYGTGDTALVLSQEQAAAFRASGMSQYGELKQRLMTTTALLTLGGTGGWRMPGRACWRGQIRVCLCARRKTHRATSGCSCCMQGQGVPLCTLDTQRSEHACHLG